AFTWSDGWVRVWDVGSAEKPRGFDVKLSMACALDPRNAQIIHGEFSNGVNRLIRRSLPPDPKDWKPVGSPVNFSSRVAAVATAFATRESGQPGEFLAVALAEATTAGPKYSLELRNPVDGRSLGKPVPLAFAATPALAASSNGFLAAASESDASVLVFETAKLAAGETRPMERLDGIGRRVTNATWVRKGDRRGVRFADGLRQMQVLDITAGEVASDRTGWQSDAAEATGWKISASAQQTETRLRIAAPNGAAATATVSARCDAFATCPTIPGIDQPIVAAAATGSDDAGWLYLFDARTGERIRKLTGHTSAVTALSFSKDGRLLLSTSSDRTVNVWWLGDLDQLIGQIGLLRGLNVAPGDDGTLVVKELADEASAEIRRVLPVGRTIRGVVNGDEPLRTFKTAGEFYRFVAESPANTQITLRTNAGDVAATIGQAIDERKPLFTLFFEDDVAAGRVSWIGWSPLGPFESSDRLVERLVGWHFNPLQPNEPVRFADLGEYREAFFGRGLLSALVTTGRVPDQWPPVQPKVSALFRDADGNPQLPDEGQSLDVEAVPAELIVEVAGVPADRVATVRWKAEEGEALEMTPAADARGVWTADLSDLRLAAGDHDLEYSAEGDGFNVVRGRVTLRMRPAAAAAPRPPELPRIVLRNPLSGTEFFDSDDGSVPPVKIEARVEAYRGPLPLEVEFLQNGEAMTANGQAVRVKLAPSDAPSIVSAEARLVPGINRVEARLVGPQGPVGSGGSVVVTRLRPPFITSLSAPEETEAAAVELTAIVRSASELKPDNVRMIVNGVSVAATGVVTEKGDVDEMWEVTIPGVPLARASNAIAVSIANADGVSRKPAEIIVARVSPAPKPVVVEFVNVPSDSTIANRELPIRMVVRASSPLTQVTFSLNGLNESLPIPEPTTAGAYHFERSLTLRAAVNTLRFTVTARDGGVGQAEARVSVIQPPVSIEIDRLVSSDGQELSPVVRDDGTVGVMGSVPTDLGTLHGRIVWSTASETPADGNVYLHSWVNGFLQSSRRVSIAGESLEHPFQIDVALNRRTGNRVRLELPALAEEEGGHRQIVLDCSDPDARQRVHLLAIGVDVPKAERDQFTSSVVESLRGGQKDDSKEDLVLYPALVGDVYAGDLLARLQLFRHRPPEPGAAHDVLLIYFRGQEASKQQGHFVLVTSDSTADPTSDESAVTSRRLSDLLEETRGAHLLFLDVAQYDVTAQPPPEWPRDSHLGVLRNVWLDQGPVPAEYSLMTELRQASRSERRLRRIADAIERNSRGRERQMFDPYIPPDLTELVLLGSDGG
nr:hypothetical protein [Planctomycetota bacterium]